MSKSLIDLRIDHAAWASALPEAATLGRRAARAALAAAALPADRPVELCLLLADDAQVRELNRIWRGQDKATNVLSFASDDAILNAPGAPLLLGDVVLALETLTLEAAAQNKSVADHFSHLVVHGVLHLAGYDHVTEAEAAVMEPMEIAVLAGLDIADPYAAADACAGTTAETRGLPAAARQLVAAPGPQSEP